MKYFIFFLSMLLSSFSFAEGFRKGTLVHTSEGFKAIETLNIGDSVLSCSLDKGSCTRKKIIDIVTHPSSPVLCIQIENEIFITDASQTVFSKEKNQWISASELYLEAGEEMDLYSLYIEEHAPYHITLSKITARSGLLKIQ